MSKWLIFILFTGVLFAQQGGVTQIPSAAGGGGGATIASTTELIQGDGAGDGVASGITVAKVTPQYSTVTYSATPTFTATSNLSAWIITLTGNVTSSTLATPTAGQRLAFNICQDGTGGRTFAWPTGFTAAATISPVASVCTRQEFTWDGSAAVPLGPAIASSGPQFGTEQAAPGTPPASGYYCWADSTDHTALQCKANNSATVYEMVVRSGTITTSALFQTGTAGVPAYRAIAATDLPVTPLITPGTSITLTAPRAYGICTGTCTVTVPVPAAGYEFCVFNGDNVSTAITLSALGSSAMYENSARTAYGTAGTGTLVVSAAAANKVCLLGLDSTHYLTVSYNGSVTVN